MNAQQARDDLTQKPFENLAERLSGRVLDSPKKSQGGAISPAATGDAGAKPMPTAAEFIESDEMDDLLMEACLAPRLLEEARRELRRILGEVAELRRTNRWDDVLALTHPVEEKAPLVAQAGLDLELRLTASFALGQRGRFEEALRCVTPLVQDFPDHFQLHASIAFNAYQSLLAGREKKVTLVPEEKRKRIELSHHHYRRCQEIRPDAVTPFYREGMLFKEVERKTVYASDCFRKAIENWEKFPAKGMEYLGKIPEAKRRHYVRWTEADLLVALGRDAEAEKVLRLSAERDRRSRHRALMRLARIHYRRGSVPESMKAARAAGEFHRNTFGSDCCEALFWEAGCLHRAGRAEEALSLLQRVEEIDPRYPHLHRLRSRISSSLHKA